MSSVVFVLNVVPFLFAEEQGADERLGVQLQAEKRIWYSREWNERWWNAAASITTS
jgi:hypothetical protein